MKRSFFQVYINNSLEALEVYQKAFDASVKDKFMDGDLLVHAEMDIEGTILALSERSEETELGNTMQICFHYHLDEHSKIKKAYDILKEKADIHHELGKTFYSDWMFDLTDRYGVRWCLFAT